jgi:hypothetical protein
MEDNIVKLLYPLNPYWSSSVLLPNAERDKQQ